MIFGTGYWALGTGDQAQYCKGQNNARYPDPSGQPSKILRLTDFGSNAMIAGSAQIMWGESQCLFVDVRR